MKSSCCHFCYQFQELQKNSETVVPRFEFTVFPECFIDYPLLRLPETVSFILFRCYIGANLLNFLYLKDDIFHLTQGYFPQKVISGQKFYKLSNITWTGSPKGTPLYLPYKYVPPPRVIGMVFAAGLV